ncbi:16S rRNA (guanine(527)-N(7))-methyltransferase RsmG [Mangrovicoccus algicola]|uniref:Ribosomal RNA small subunit methyltransferase G n=1 Tax=Mangrovicoccus algicola TaxID=2771008 RepID=A0A8J6YV01_9RHOB|nr:16S rRNA (guanine(527)-N(7))-methyltransferase RsmG [Mangrovicoccus algicola]MBE3638275.1 16S rRNA (guanine(527)-N(7))-methyltransferase RsmG [Mangrovicoccus algicola]
MAADQFDVSRETRDRLRIYQGLLEKWNSKINLVAPSTLAESWERHFLDSLQVFHLQKEEPRHWCDLGSGAGFPGMVAAIAAVGAGWNSSFTLIESDQRKCTFLRTVSRETGIPVTILAERIEDAPAQRADVISARALAPLPRLLPWVLRHVAPNGRAFLPKGRKYQQEIEEVRDNFAFSLEINPSQVDSESVILKLESIRDV